MDVYIIPKDAYMSIKNVIYFCDDKKDLKVDIRNNKMIMEISVFCELIGSPTTILCYLNCVPQFESSK